jgi:hypothetical protein
MNAQFKVGRRLHNTAFVPIRLPTGKKKCAIKASNLTKLNTVIQLPS